MSPLSAQLRAARKAHQLTQQQLAQRLGWAQTRVSTIESGKIDPRLSNFIQMARLVDHELMLVPRSLVPAVQAMLSGKMDEPLWSIDEKEGSTQ